MTREELIRDFFVEEKYDMLICKRCKSALWSRGEKFMSTTYPVICADELDEFIADGGLKEAEDGSEERGCEWCEEVDDLYGVYFGL